MALPQSALSELLEVFRAGDGVGLIRESVCVALQEMIELEATERIGAAPYERTESRLTERNSHRARVLTTKAGDVDLRIPKLRKGSFLPVILEPRRRIDQALYAVVMEAFVHGVSTRAVDNPVEAMGAVVAWTSRARIRVALTPQIYDPVLLAKALATADRIADGRLHVTLGVGVHDEDYGALGIDANTQNVHELNDRVLNLRWIWRGDHLTNTTAPVGPRTLQLTGPPLSIASSGLQAVRIAAGWADGVVHLILGPHEPEPQDLQDVFAFARAA